MDSFTSNNGTEGLKQQIVFVSHGSPSLVIENDNPANQFLRGLGSQIGKPSAIIIISAHWESKVVEVSAQSPELIYDFGGFPDKLYRQVYQPPGSPELAEKILEALKAKGVACAANNNRGLDHGAWCPLKLMYPEADIPVVQVSLVKGLDPQLHLKIGEALTPLLETERNLLILASGGVTHNLGDFSRRQADGKPSAWATEFASFVEEVLTKKEGDDRKAAIGAFETHQYAKQAHPRTEHFLPLLVTAGIEGTDKAVKLYDGFQWNFSLEAYAFPLQPKN